jgi:predicted NBD/HSP70 family sugar kinase
VSPALNVVPRHRPVLDDGFVPAVLWNRAYRTRVASEAGRVPVLLALTRPDGTVYREQIEVLPHEGDNVPLNIRYVERIVKLMLWMKGGSEIVIAGHDELAREIADIYRPQGPRAFDSDLVGRRIFQDTMTVRSCAIEQAPPSHVASIPLGRHLDGRRIGFDLGGSDRKCAAVIDGRLVYSEEVEWSPYFQSDPRYHYDGIMDSLVRAAARLPRVDAIGGSAAGVYVDNEPRVGSLFRGVSEQDFETHIRPMFKRLKAAWREVPFEVVNDGEVTALAASIRLNANTLLGISMGTSLAAGYCDADGHITSQLNELAFVPVDYREGAPVDEWSGDAGCGVQYFSQQAVARLASPAGIDLPEDMALADRLKRVQALMVEGDERAAEIYRTIGTYLGYSVAWYAEWYDIRNLLILGRVTSGAGGELIIREAREVLRNEFPEVGSRIRLNTPDEQFKRHGQAIAAASLPKIER